MLAEYVNEIAEITREEREETSDKQGTVVRVGFKSTQDELKAMWLDGSLCL